MTDRHAGLKMRYPCILVRVHQALDEFVVTGKLRFVTGSMATFHTGRNEPQEDDGTFNWLTAKTYLQPELSTHVDDAFVFAHPVDAACFLLHFAGGNQLKNWSAREPGCFRRGEYVREELIPPWISYLRMTGAMDGVAAPNPGQIWAAYRTLVRADLAFGLPDADWIIDRFGPQP